MTKKAELDKAWDATLPKIPPRSTRAERYFMGVSSKSNAMIMPMAPVQIECFPMLRFRPTLFFVDPMCASHFDIHSIRIGAIEKFVDFGPIPASAFSLRMIDDEIITPGVTIQWETMEPGQRLVVQVENISDKARRFRAACEGLASW